MCKLADDTSNRVIAVVAAARPEDTNFVEQLRRGAHPRRVGIRRVLHVVDDDVSRAPLFRRHVALLADHGLSFDICMRADQLPLAQELVQGAPATRFILDHGGNPPLGQPDGLNRWREEVSRLSQHANVVCKLSGLVNHLPAGANALEVLQPIVNHLLTCFGWQRLLFGSDWPVCTLANLDVPAWLDMARRLTAHLPEAASQAIFTTNALCVYQQEQKSV